MPVDRDDPRLTAYALGELDDPAEVAEIEALLKADPDAGQLVAEVRETARWLSDGLRSESSPGLESGQKAAIMDCVSAPPAPAVLPLVQEARPARPFWKSWGTLAAAATLLVGGTVVLLQRSVTNPRSGAKSMNDDVRYYAPATAPLATVAGQPAAGFEPSSADTSLFAETASVRARGAATLTEAKADRPAAVELAANSPKPSDPAPAGATNPGTYAWDAMRSEQAQGGHGPMNSRMIQNSQANFKLQAGQAGQQVQAGQAQAGRNYGAPGRVSGGNAQVASTPALVSADQPASRSADRRSLGVQRFDVIPSAPADSNGTVAGVAMGGGGLGGEGTRYGLDASVSEGLAVAPAPASAASVVTAPAPAAAPVAGFEPVAATAEAKPVELALSESRDAVKEGEVLAKRLTEVAEKQKAEKVQQQLAATYNKPQADFDREQYRRVQDNPFTLVAQQPLSTFSIDVDTASYANVRRFLLQQSILPPPDAVRIEEMVNYFHYDYPRPTGDDPFSVNVDIARCPWNADHRLARIGLKGREIQADKRPASNLVFLVDVSGSMNSPEKLPLLRDGLKMLVNELTENDRVSIVVYANQQGTLLDPTTGDKKAVIMGAIDSLTAGGSTHGSAGIEAAYDLASRNFIVGGTNRVLLCTDGDFNVGITDDGSLERFITEKAKTKVFLTVLGFGTGNLQDAKMESLADKGNGNYHYIDNGREARKVLVEELGQTLITIAKDVKIQVDFNPAKVGAYRLIGYENRMLAAQDFRDDKKDAGEIGAGHTVTALYELVPPDKIQAVPGAEPSEFVKPAAEPAANDAKESFIVRLRSKPPEGDTSTERKYPVVDEGKDYADASADYKWAASVAAFGMILRESPPENRGTATIDAVMELATAGKGEDRGGYRQEFLEMVSKAKALTPGRQP